MNPYSDDHQGVVEPSSAQNQPPPDGSAPPAQENLLPDGWRIFWDWVHCLVFLIFALGCYVILQIGYLEYIASARHLPAGKATEVLMTDSAWVVGMQTTWMAVLLLFLYVTLGLLRETAFWPALGWHRLPRPAPPKERTNPLVYFFTGSFLSALVLFGGQAFRPKGKMPIEEIFSDPHGLLLLMAMAVLVAPLMEETVFRGYLYPLLAETAAFLAHWMGQESEQALRNGRAVSIVITGCLFGMMHGAQTGWTLGIVGMLSVVGIIFTYARARTGTVLASYLLHLGYNSALAVLMAISTGGFRHMPIDR